MEFDSVERGVKMGVEIKVTTQELKNAAQNLQNISDKVLKLYDQIGEEAQKFPAQWEGEAQEVHRQKLSSVLEDARKAAQELKERPGRLLTIAGVYETSEQQNVDKTSGLNLDENVIT
jgi:WXG100 family type VII secretion target